MSGKREVGSVLKFSFMNAGCNKGYICLFCSFYRFLYLLFPIISQPYIPNEFYLTTTNRLKEFYFYFIFFSLLKMELGEFGMKSNFSPVINDQLIIDVESESIISF